MSIVFTSKRKREQANSNDTECDFASVLSNSSSQEDFYAKALRWKLEQDFESRPRKSRKKEKDPARLPIKTCEGQVKPSILPVIDDEECSSVLSAQEHDVRIEEAASSGVDPLMSSKEQIRNAQEELARIAGLFNENPEEHANLFRSMIQLAESPNVVVKKLALATQMTVFKDVIPGYRIRPLSHADTTEKVSKDVKRLRNFEQGLISSYRMYIKQLEKCARLQAQDPSNTMFSVKQVAVSCACSLLLAVPHFNFRGELLQILVATLSSKQRSSSFQKCLDTLETLFREDEDGKPSLDAVTFVTKTMKARGYQVDEAILNSFLHLRLLDSLSLRGSYNRIDRPSDLTPEKGKALKLKREFRTKKRRKVLKEQKKVEKDFKAADAVVDHEEYERIQSEILKLVFVTYFRILKAKTPGLMGAVLEGLSKYTHLINQDFFGDILEALKDLIGEPLLTLNNSEEEDASSDSVLASSSSLRPSLLCITTAFTLLAHQDISLNASSAALALDLSFFTTHLYRILHVICLDPDLEVSSKTPKLPDPDRACTEEAKPQVNTSTMPVLLLRSLNAVLTPRLTPPLKVAAFTKNLLTSTLQLPEKSSVAFLVLMQQVLKVHAPELKGMWDTDERKGDGAFDALNADIEGSNPFASSVWEGELLKLHFSPKVKEATGSMERLLKEPR